LPFCPWTGEPGLFNIDPDALDAARALHQSQPELL
jgi:hypothetical protein